MSFLISFFYIFTPIIRNRSVLLTLLAKFLSQKPDKVEKVENAIIAEYSKYFEKDKMFWTKLIGNIIGDTSFVVPSLRRANYNFGLLNKLNEK